MDQDGVQAIIDEILAEDAINIRRVWRNCLMYSFDVMAHSRDDFPPPLPDENIDDIFEYGMLQWITPIGYHAGDLPHRRIQQRREGRENLAQEDPAYAAFLQEALSGLHISDTEESSVASTTHENEPENGSQRIGDGQPQDNPTTDADSVGPVADKIVNPTTVGPVAEESANSGPLYPRNSNTPLRILSVGGRELTHLGPRYIAYTSEGLKRFSEETIEEHGASHLLRNYLRWLSSRANPGVGQPSNTPRHPSVDFPSKSPFRNNGRTGFGPRVGNPLNSQHMMDVDLSVGSPNKPADENPDAESDKPADGNSDAESNASVTGIKPDPDAGPSNQGPGGVIEIESDHSSMDLDSDHDSRHSENQPFPHPTNPSIGQLPNYSSADEMDMDDWPAAPEDDYLTESSATTNDTPMARPVPLSTMVWADSMFPFLLRIQVTGVQLAPTIEHLPLLSQYTLRPLEAFTSIFESMHIIVASLGPSCIRPFRTRHRDVFIRVTEALRPKTRLAIDISAGRGEMSQAELDSIARKQYRKVLDTIVDMHWEESLVWELIERLCALRGGTKPNGPSVFSKHFVWLFVIQ